MDASSRHALVKPADAKTLEESPMPNQYTYVPKKPVIRVIGPSIAYVTLTMGKFALVDSDDADDLSLYNWHVMKSRGTLMYACRKGKNLYMAMHRHITKTTLP